MLARLSARFDLVKAYFAGDRNFHFSIPNLLVNGVFKSPCTRIGPRFIESITEADPYLVVRVRSVSKPLYWPCELPLFFLYKVVAECFYTYDWHFYEVPETKVSEGDVVLDCGAAEGIFSLRVVDRASLVAAFEPLPLFVNTLRKTFAGHKNVSLVPCALGDAGGEGYLAGDPMLGAVNPNGEGLPIRVTTIDRWVGETGHRVDFIKADLEGYETKVLKGAAETIRRYGPRIAITVYHPGNDWNEMLARLRALVPEYNYRIKGLSYNGGHARPVMLHCWVGKG
jgi:FkbM family methyltransferase